LPTPALRPPHPRRPPSELPPCPTRRPTPPRARAARSTRPPARGHRRRRFLLEQLEPADRARLQQAIARAFLPDRKARKERHRAAARAHRDAEVAHDDALLDATGIRTLRAKPVFTTPNVFPPQDFQPQDINADAPRETRQQQHCYVCKVKYTRLHHFYDQLCTECGDLNYRKRTETADLRGRVALLTGGRVKIGYQAGLKLLRAGATLIVTTRFPRDSAERYAEEPDFADWEDRLEVFGLDLRHTPSVEAFCAHLLATRPRLDYIINNACQTGAPSARVLRAHDGRRARRRARRAAASARAARCVRRPARAGAGGRGRGAGFGGDRRGRRAARDGPGRSRPSGSVDRARHRARRELSQVPLLADELLGQQHLFPEGRFDKDLQQVDLRGKNSWRMRMHEVPTVEVLETQLVNAVAPFLINSRLKPLLLRTPERDKHIVNVSAVEGQFYRNFKTTRHPHTNMAKAALNMMTRTSAADYHADGIHMNCVDTGWVTDEDPIELAAQRRARSASIRRWTSSTARRASSTRSSPARTPASTCGASSSRTTPPPTGSPRWVVVSLIGAARFPCASCRSRGAAIALAWRRGAPVRARVSPVESATPTVYVIDDEPDVLRALSRLLRFRRHAGANLTRGRPSTFIARVSEPRFAHGCVVARPVDARTGRTGGAAAAGGERLPVAEWCS
jgi:NAD(P)-dependent dehydrogenase (short-subunit alcohol dehydrogenase family)